MTDCRQRCSRIEANIVEYAYIHHCSSGAQSFRVGVVGGTRADARRPSSGRRHAPGQRDDLMGLLTG